VTHPNHPPNWVTAIPSDPSVHDAAQFGTATGATSNLWDQLGRAIEAGIDMFVGQIAVALGGIEIAGWKPLEWLAQWGQDLIDKASDAYQRGETLGGLFGIDWGGDDVGGRDDIWNWTVDHILKPLVDWLSPDSPLNADNIFGTLFPGGIPLAKLTTTPENELDNPDFRSAISLSGAADWQWVDNVHFADSTNSGSAKTVADGHRKALRSNPIDTIEDKSLTLSVEVLAAGLAGTGEPVQLFAVPDGRTPELLDSAWPAGGDSGWRGAPNGATSALLSGSYDGDAASVRMRIVVDESATAGTVYFDHAKAFIVGGWLERTWTQISDIFDAFANATTQTDFEAAFNLVLDLLSLPHQDSFWSWFADSFLGPLGVFVDQQFWDDVGAFFDTGFRWLTGLGPSWADVTDAFNTAASRLHFSPPTAQDFWHSIARLLLGPWTTQGFAYAAADLIHTLLRQINGTASQADTKAAWSALVQAAPAGSLWALALQAVKFMADLNTLISAFFTQLFGPSTAHQNALNAAFDEVMADLGVSNANTTDLMANAVAAWFSPWDKLWNQIINALTGGSNLGNNNDQNPDWLQQLWSSLFQIPNNNVNPSMVGGVDIGDSIQQFVNSVFDAHGDGRVGDKNISEAAQAIVDKLNEFDGRLIVIENGSGGHSDQHAPERAKYHAQDSYTLHTADIPSWATHVQAAGVGGGGGGGGGLWGSGNNTGFAGGETTIKVGSNAQLTCGGGAGAKGDTVNWVTESYGEAAGNKTYDKVLYVGGGQVKYKHVGLEPGGGGGGGEFMNFQGYGGKAGKWNYHEYSLSGVSTISIHIGAGGDPNHIGSGGPPVTSGGFGSFNSGRGGRGAAWLRFIKK
jgi:hypothetical protein